ncbi:HPr family phosphocarrier protein [Salisediminibacterium halotolerans]|uniref:HPr family phosphocarrier protein n=1 Tax=Salisediminibacterium halotolerans TaxID=517425 RepID=UPI000EAC318A|nr:HPr family phosphocarrier protein [Salisediminibacterium halotolerans]RLJ78346.1 phosphocarrier protein [Actinophytocola xinjiangensis]RPE88312.1 phosphocarrier protein [Salisediminibacterium halotolerans]TWG37322.1 phosphocarrier protein [Salisediminibacterium halotolerans]GEL06787.1 hypothetical protein SHA02_02030 [Salisediminibacterium halotolerans]
MQLTVKTPIFGDNATKITEIAGKYPGKVLVKKDHWVVEAKSLLGLLALALQPGDTVEVELEGDVDNNVIDEFVETGLFA